MSPAKEMIADVEEAEVVTKNKVVSMLRGHDGNLIVLTDDGRIFERARNPRADPNFSGRNPDANFMWVEREGPLSVKET